MQYNSYELTFKSESRYWWFTARAEIFTYLFKQYIKKTPVSHTPLILNIGCGTGILTEKFSTFGNVVSLDYSEKALKFCGFRKLGSLVRADAEKLPFSDNSFDAVLCFDILEHIGSDGAAVAELYRVLKTDGIAMISVPAFKFLWSSFDDLNWHKRRYRKRHLKKMLADNKLEPVKLSYFNFFLFPIALIRRFYEKLFKRTQQDYYIPHVGKFVNLLFSRIFSFERFLLKTVNFPWGVSIIAVCRKS